MKTVLPKHNVHIKPDKIFQILSEPDIIHDTETVRKEGSHTMGKRRIFSAEFKTKLFARIAPRRKASW